MGDFNDAFMRNNPNVQARAKAQNRANVMQLKLVSYNPRSVVFVVYWLRLLNQAFFLCQCFLIVQVFRRFFLDEYQVINLDDFMSCCYNLFGLSLFSKGKIRVEVKYRYRLYRLVGIMVQSVVVGKLILSPSLNLVGDSQCRFIYNLRYL